MSRLYETSESVDRLELGSFVEYRNLEDEFPSVIGYGFIERVMRKTLDRFVASERVDDAPDFTSKTIGALDDLYVIKYIDPLFKSSRLFRKSA